MPASLSVRGGRLGAEGIVDWKYCYAAQLPQMIVNDGVARRKSRGVASQIPAPRIEEAEELG